MADIPSHKRDADTIGLVTIDDVSDMELMEEKNKRPGIGFFPANKLKLLIGKKAKKNIQKNRLIKKTDV